jgi:predicted acetyltransferase
MTEFRTPEEADRQQVIDLIRISFNVPSAWERHLAPKLRLDRALCAYEDGRPIAMAVGYDLRQWLAGRDVPAHGVGLVAVTPERRGSGIAPDLLRVLLRRARERGAAVSLLYPSRAAVYRRLGYEYSGVLTQYEVRLDELPSTPPGPVEEIGEGSIGAVRSCYQRFASTQNGLVECADEDWWDLRVLRRGNPDLNVRSALIRGESGAEGYAAFQLEPVPEGMGFRMVCTHMIAASESGLEGLLGYFSGFRGLGEALVWYGPPNEPLGLRVGRGGESLRVLRSVRFMSRLLDVAGALEARGGNPVSGTAEFAVQDDLFPDNGGPFRLEADKGRVRVTRCEVAGAPVIPIGALSAVFSGYLSPTDLSRVGALHGEDAVPPLLWELFSGASPWMTDFF